ncbi:STAS domain-containing protein [Streptomyces sp. NPDC002306]
MTDPRAAVPLVGQDALNNALLSRDTATAPLRIVVDLSGVTFIDSGGLNTLITAHHQASNEQGWLRLAAAPKPVLHLLEVTGIDTLIACSPTTEHALTTP